MTGMESHATFVGQILGTLLFMVILPGVMVVLWRARTARAYRQQQRELRARHERMAAQVGGPLLPELRRMVNVVNAWDRER